MPAALPYSDRVSQGSTRKRTNRVITTQFGEGYAQSRPDGINSLIDEWSVSFENLDATERATLCNVLDAVGSWDYLTWTPPGRPAAKWKVTADGYSETPSSGEHYTIAFTLRQFF
jgi:phage-related protein